MRRKMPAPETTPTAPEPDSLVRQRQRFNWLAERLERWVGYYEVAELERFAEGSAAWPGQHEKALVLLVLTGTPEAKAAIAELDISDAPAPYQKLYQVALEYLGPEEDGKSDE